MALGRVGEAVWPGAGQGGMSGGPSAGAAVCPLGKGVSSIIDLASSVTR